jgi:hypothetical protein
MTGVSAVTGEPTIGGNSLMWIAGNSVVHIVI